MTQTHPVELEQLPDIHGVQLTKVTTSPPGRQFRAVTTGSLTVITDVKHPKGGTIVIEGGAAAPLLGEIVGFDHGVGHLACGATCTFFSVPCPDPEPRERQVQ